MASPTEQGERTSQSSAISSSEAGTRASSVAKTRIANEGDVVLVFNTPVPHELTVKGGVLSEASPIFKAMLTSDPEAQLSRSVANPQRLAVGGQQVLIGLTVLCSVLHDCIIPMDRTDERGSYVLFIEMAQVERDFGAV